LEFPREGYSFKHSSTVMSVHQHVQGGKIRCSQEGLTKD